MSMAMYKPEEGYWTRILSMIGWGLVVAWLASWLWGQAGSIVIEGVETNYIRGAFAGVSLLLGGGLVYWLVYLRKPSSEFLIATDSEMKKVNWSTRREVLGSTWVVIGVSLILAFCLFLADFVFRLLFTAIGVLETA